MNKNKEQRDAEMAEMIQEYEASMKKWDEAERAITELLEAAPLWQEAKKTEVIDWNEGREAILKKGVTVTNIFSTEEWTLDVQDHCYVCNFPSLTVKNAHLTDSIFVNCGQITLEEGTAVRCIFSDVKTIFLDNTKVFDSTFRDLHCEEGGLIISMEDSVVSGCKFFDIRLENENYLADGVGDCLVEKCDFKRISTDREDRELFTCEELSGKMIRKRRAYDMVDRDSCTGLDCIERETAE